MIERAFIRVGGPDGAGKTTDLHPGTGALVMVNMTIFEGSRPGDEGDIMARNVSLAEAKARLSQCVREAERGDFILITRHGRPVAGLVGAAELERLELLRAAGPEGGLASLAGGWEGSEELADSLAARTRNRRPRSDDPDPYELSS